jgi:5,5'-dehydrodivanillate O-demethylase
MLTVSDNDRISRVSPGSPMGDMMRRYWQPIATVEDLEREEVKAVRILGENLVLYKSTTGTYGLIQERCPHRSASLAYGIPHEDGIRCPYHGWLFNEDGKCLEMPFEDVENPEAHFRDKITVDSYPVETLGGLVFTYMGPIEKKPLLPRWEWFTREDVNRSIGITHLPCNWLQCMENSMDPVHFEWLHANLINYVAKRRGEEPLMFPAKHQKVAFDVFEYGIYKRRLLQGDDPETSPDWLIGHPVLFPNILDTGGSYQIRVPIDDHNTLHFLYRASVVKEGEEPKINVADVPWKHDDGRLVVETVIGTDMMAWITQGPITPRHLEHLGVSDRGIILYRSILSDAIEAVERGEDPPGIVRDVEKNFPMITYKTEYSLEQGARAAFLLPGQAPRQQGAPSVAVGIPTTGGQRAR